MDKPTTAPRIQMIHDTDPSTPAEIYAYVHCTKCIDEYKSKPRNITPAKWARTQVGWTANGFQVWCTRHDINITNVALRLATDGVTP